MIYVLMTDNNNWTKILFFCHCIHFHYIDDYLQFEPIMPISNLEDNKFDYVFTVQTTNYQRIVGWTRFLLSIFVSIGYEHTQKRTIGYDCEVEHNVDETSSSSFLSIGNLLVTPIYNSAIVARRHDQQQQRQHATRGSFETWNFIWWWCWWWWSLPWTWKISFLLEASPVQFSPFSHRMLCDTLTDRHSSLRILNQDAFFFFYANINFNFN